MSPTKCPTCDAPVSRPAPGEKSAFPFCSQRCRSVDLGNWIDERYRVDAEPVPEETLTSEN